MNEVALDKAIIFFGFTFGAALAWAFDPLVVVATGVFFCVYHAISYLRSEPKDV